MKQAVVDANLLVLLVAGNVDPRIIKRHKRLSAYRIVDYEKLASLIGEYERVLFIPNVISEASNLLSQIDGATARILLEGLRAQIMNSAESYIPSHVEAERLEYLWLGLTDSALLHCLALDPQRTLLTVDMDLHNAALRIRRNSINWTPPKTQVFDGAD